MINFPGDINTSEKLQAVFVAQSRRFATGETLPVAFRVEQLKRLRKAIIKHQDAILEALHEDLHKPSLEAYEGEIMSVLREVSYAIKHLKKWMKEERLPRDLFFPFGKAWATSEPYGVVVVMAPYNFPFSINLGILAGAITAGNCVLLKPSEKTTHSLEILQKIIAEAFDEDYVAVVTGGIPLSQEILTLPIGYVYFVGSTMVGKLVMEAAAKQLIPLSLGLSGKCPAIVDSTVSLDRVAERIVWAKFFNNGQSCTTIDYLLVDREVKDELLERMVFYIKKFYGENAQASDYYGRVIDEKHFDKVIAYTKEGTAYYGGGSDRADRYIEPTIMVDIPEGAKSRQEEIFGPVLPVFEYGSGDEALEFVGRNPNPLAVYVYSNDAEFQERVMGELASGGVCINDALIHNIAPYTPSGGVYQSGFGRLHGKYAFDAFTYKRTFFKRGTSFDPPGRFPPYRKIFLKLLKKVIR